jgi:hypothetical protein
MEDATMNTVPGLPHELWTRYDMMPECTMMPEGRSPLYGPWFGHYVADYDAIWWRMLGYLLGLLTLASSLLAMLVRG